MFFEIYGAASLPLNIQASKIETIYYDSLIITINLKVTTWSIIVSFFWIFQSEVIVPSYSPTNFIWIPKAGLLFSL